MEKQFAPFNWTRLFLGNQPYAYYLEVALRILLVFLVLVLVLRLLGKRGQRNLSPMQQILMIALGSAAGDTLLYPSVAIFYATLILLGATGLTLVLDWAARRWRVLRDYLESHPRVLVRDGRVDDAAMASERVNDRELHAALREAGARSLAQVELAILEVTGHVSVFLNDVKPLHDDLLDPLKASHARQRPRQRAQRQEWMRGKRGPAGD